MRAIWQDLRYAARGLRAKPGFTAAVVFTLGLGIGANAAMFGIIDRLLFRPPTYMRDPGTVHRVYLARVFRDTENAASSMQFKRYLDIREMATTASQSAAFFWPRIAVGVGDDAREMIVGTVSASFFEFFDIQPVLGRFFTAREDSVPTGAPVAVLGYAHWQVRYGGRRDVLGMQMPIGPKTYTIIGVAPEGFTGMTAGMLPVAFIPITAFAAGQKIGAPSDFYMKYSWSWMEMIVRRKPGVSEAALTADLTTAFRRSYERQRESNPRTTPAEIAKPRAIAAPVLRERGPNQGANSKVAAWVSGVAAIVLVIACANVANLLLARALRRRREIAVRLALGASRARLVSQLLTESLVLAVLGGGLGLIVAQWGGGILRALFLARSDTAIAVADARTLLFTAGAVIAAALLTGLAPALQSGRDDLATTLKAGQREGTYTRSRLRVALLVLQGALSVMLLVGAGLFVRSLHNVRSMRIGFDVDDVLYVSPTLRGVTLSDTAEALLKQRLLDEAKAMPGVVNAARQVTVPFNWTSVTSLFVPGIDSVHRLGDFYLQSVSPEYFQTFGTRILRGRGISADDRSGAPRAVVVSESMAKTLWPGRDALGQCMRVSSDTLPCSYVVGIAENIRVQRLRGDPEMQYYVSIDQAYRHQGGLYVRTRGDASAVREALRKRLQRLMPGAAYVTVTPMREVLAPELRSWQLGATMFTAFGVLALVLAAVGLYSVIAYGVTQRTHELGVRVALGAQIADVLRLVVSEGVRLGAIGIALGGALALWGVRWLAPLLFDVPARDPWVFAIVGATLLLVAVLASLLPAWRASRVDPSVALRVE